MLRSLLLMSLSAPVLMVSGAPRDYRGVTNNNIEASSSGKNFAIKVVTMQNNPRESPAWHGAFLYVPEDERPSGRREFQYVHVSAGDYRVGISRFNLDQGELSYEDLRFELDPELLSDGVDLCTAKFVPRETTIRRSSTSSQCIPRFKKDRIPTNGAELLWEVPCKFPNQKESIKYSWVVCQDLDDKGYFMLLWGLVDAARATHVCQKARLVLEE